ncbi:hypothetical protein HYX58_04875 [Candidatus Dependentiae bacterium]|nr:hypothetical protein [Candidatus Dependentiae bacterium]
MLKRILFFTIFFPFGAYSDDSLKATVSSHAIECVKKLDNPITWYGIGAVAFWYKYRPLRDSKTKIENKYIESDYALDNAKVSREPKADMPNAIGKQLSDKYSNWEFKDFIVNCIAGAAFVRGVYLIHKSLPQNLR